MESEPSAEVRVRVSGDGARGQLRSLSAWLSDDVALRGRWRLVAAPPGPGSMGAATEVLAITLGPGGLATALAATLIAWIRSRTGAVSVEFSRRDGTTMRLDAKNVRALAPEQASELADRLLTLLTADNAIPDGATPDGPVQDIATSQ